MHCCQALGQPISARGHGVIATSIFYYQSYLYDHMVKSCGHAYISTIKQKRKEEQGSEEMATNSRQFSVKQKLALAAKTPMFVSL